MFIHNIGVTWFDCGCEINSTSISSKRRKSGSTKKPAIAVPESGGNLYCQFKAKTKGEIKKHKAQAHGIDVQWWPCDFKDCVFKAKSASNLASHKQYQHKIGVKWCARLASWAKNKMSLSYPTNSSNLLTRRPPTLQRRFLLYAFNRRYVCTECDFKKKQRSATLKHMADIHKLTNVHPTLEREGGCTTQSTRPLSHNNNATPAPPPHPTADVATIGQLPAPLPPPQPVSASSSSNPTQTPQPQAQPQRQVLTNPVSSLPSSHIGEYSDPNTNIV